MKSYTDLEQSKKLAEILPLESADMYYDCGDEYDLRIGSYKAMDLDLDIPAWSLSALLELMPRSIRSNQNGQIYLTIHRSYENSWTVEYSFDDIDTNYLEKRFDKKNPIDAAFEMVVWLKENKYI